MRDRLPFLLIALLVAGGLAVLLLTAQRGEERRVNTSVQGFALLEPWLKSQDIAVEASNTRLTPKLSELSLRILPLHDMDLANPVEPGATPRDNFYSSTLLDTTLDDFNLKTYELPTLVILPKWVAGVSVRKVAHPSVLIPAGDYSNFFLYLGLESDPGLHRPQRGFLTARSPMGEVVLFEPQVFDNAHLPKECRSRLAIAAGTLVLECALPHTPGMPPIYFLSDPDLMNNHGLRLGGNAGVAAKLVRELAARKQGRIYLDTTAGRFTVSEKAEMNTQGRIYERDAANLARFFDPPFTALWALLAIVMGIAFWRGAVRFGPVAVADRATPERSKTAAVATKARLLRLSGHDGHLVADYVRADLARLTRQIFGPAAGQAGQVRLFSHLARRDPAAAQELHRTVEALTDPAANLSAADRARQLHTYLSLLETLTDGHDPDRVPTAR